MIYVLGLLAKAGHGKTTVARHLAQTFGAQTRSLAAPLKRAVKNVFGFTDAQLWGTQEEKEAIDPRYGFSPRWLLQRLGTEGLRQEFGDEIHVHALLHGLRKEQLARAPESGGSSPLLYVVDDVRFPNDAAAIARGGPDFAGAVLKIVATDVAPPAHAGHPSESAIDAVNSSDIAVTVSFAHRDGVAHMLAAVECALLTAPSAAMAALRPALRRLR